MKKTLLPVTDPFPSPFAHTLLGILLRTIEMTVFRSGNTHFDTKC